MNTTRTILLKRIAAGILLALFLLVHFVKLTHHHNSIQPVLKGYTKASPFSGAGDCSICMYHLAKDSDHCHSFVLTVKAAAYASVYHSYNTPFVTSVGAASSGRGPPAHS